MRLNLKAAPALAVLALVMLASGAAKAQTTADQVVDNETLKAFVEGAKAEIEAITDINEGAKLRDRLRTEGPWEVRIDVPHHLPQERGTVHPRE